MIHCLMNTGRPIAGTTAEVLYRKACEMADTKKKRLSFKAPDCQGFLTTKWASGSMGTISGVEFKAEVADSKGETTVTFIVRTFDLENSAWTGFESAEDASTFSDTLEAQERRAGGRLH